MVSQEVATEYETEVVPLTLEIAKHYNRMATLKGDRDPDSSRGKIRVAWLHGVLQSGRFHSPVWSTVQVSSEKGKKYRVDGGHSAKMLTQAGTYFPEDMSVTIRHFRAPNIEAAMFLYEQFNQLHSTRTITDLIRNRASYEGKLNNVSTTSVGNAARGICCHLGLHNPGEKFDPLEQISPQAEFIKWANKFASIKRFRKVSIMGAMYATWIISKSAADEFWTMTCDEIGKTPTCPTRVLAKFLREITGDTLRKTKWSNHAVYVKCLHAWNAWRQCKTTTLSYHKGCALPKLL